MLKAVDGLKNEHLADTSLSREIKFQCPECEQSVILKAGRFKIAHFAHKPGGSCVFGAGESMEHMRIKKLLYEKLKTLTPDVTLEQRIGNHIVDIYAKIDGRRFCYEVQLSPISPDEILDRMRAYSKIGAATVWILNHKNLDAYENIDGEVIAIKRWWMFLQKMQYGINFFFRRNEFILMRLEEASIWRESTDFGGGYEYYYKNSKTVNLGPAICFSELRSRGCNENSVITYSIPRDKVWWRKNMSYKDQLTAGENYET